MAGVLLLVAWGTFAFGAVYPWAYTPLAAGCAVLGLAGLAIGDRPLWSPHRLLLLTFAGVAAVGLLQLVPLPRSILSTVSPGTVAHLAQYDFAWSRGIDPLTGAVADLRHPISLAPRLTVTALLLFGSLVLLLAGLLRVLSRTIAGHCARGIVVIGCLLAVVGIGQKALLGDNAYLGMRIYGFWQPEYVLSTPFGPYVNKNHFAGWMLMAIPLTLGLATAQVKALTRPLRDIRDLLLWMSEPEGGRMMLYLVAATVMTLSLLMTGSRSGIGCLALLFIGATVAAGRHGSLRSMAIAGVATVVVLGGALTWAGRDARLDRFVSDNESIGMRLDIWSMAARMVPAFPMLGSGLDTFGTATMRYEEPDATGRRLHYNEAHNDYVQLLVEGGVVVLALVLLGLIAIIRSARSRLSSRDDGVELHWIRVGAAAGLALIAVQAMVEFSLQMPGNAVLFVVLLALTLFVPAQLRSKG